jgi:hypothetical protein
MSLEILYVSCTAVIVLTIIQSTRTLGRDLRVLLTRLDEIVATLRKQP